MNGTLVGWAGGSGGVGLVFAGNECGVLRGEFGTAELAARGGGWTLAYDRVHPHNWSDPRQSPHPSGHLSRPPPRHCTPDRVPKQEAHTEKGLPSFSKGILLLGFMSVAKMEDENAGGRIQILLGSLSTCNG